MAAGQRYILWMEGRGGVGGAGGDDADAAAVVGDEEGGRRRGTTAGSLATYVLLLQAKQDSRERPGLCSPHAGGKRLVRWASGTTTKNFLPQIDVFQGWAYFCWAVKNGRVT